MPRTWYSDSSFGHSTGNLDLEHYHAFSTPRSTLECLRRKQPEDEPSSWEVYAAYREEQTQRHESNESSRSAPAQQPQRPSSHDAILEDTRNRARAFMLRRASGSSSLLQIYTFSQDEEPRKPPSSFIKRVKSFIMRHTFSSSSGSMDIYTYVDQNSRMMHHSHGMDGFIIDMF
jgi:hypothetical protein